MVNSTTVYRILRTAAMASEGESKSRPTNTANKKKRRAHYLPYNKPSKKGYAAVRPGVQGIFITCDGGREWQAKTEAINLLDKFYEELLQTKGPDTDGQAREQAPSVRPARALSRISDDGSSSSSGESGQDSGDENVQNGKDEGEREGEGGSPVKKRRLEIVRENDNESKCNEVQETRESTIDQLLEAEIEELGDREKVRFAGLDSGCNGVIFIRMRKEDACLNPSELVEYIMNKAASTRKHMSRFILRLLPVELTCYASAEEIARAAKPVIEQHFPNGEDQLPIKFAVLYEARANSGIERSKIIDTVAKMVPHPHKVDLSNPDQTIIVQIVKTICMIGVVHRFKELSKYNLRQLTGFKQP